MPAPIPDSSELRAQLERILASQLFLHSRRYPALLRHVVENTLAGNVDALKERTLGISVFGRDPAYDTSADPVVRTTASEVRKRLDEYYSAPDHAGEPRIILPVGSYVPVFPATVTPANTAPEPVPAVSGFRRSLILAAAMLTLVAAGLAFTLHQFAQDPLRQFWEPALNSSSPVLVVVETLMGVPKTGPASTVTEIIDPKLFLVINDSNSRLAAYFSRNGASLEYDLARNMNLARLRPHPFILRGAFNNPLTRQSVSAFRYYLNLNVTQTEVVRQIVDHQNPAHHWDAPMGPLSKDFALIARAPEPRTGQTMFVIAGLGERGGAAATEFLTNPKFMQRFAAQAPKDWENRNLEIIVETDLSNDDWGEPRIVAYQIW